MLTGPDILIIAVVICLIISPPQWDPAIRLKKRGIKPPTKLPKGGSAITKS